MKGVILGCLSEMVKKQHGDQAWKASLKDAGLLETSIFLAGQDVSDEETLKVVGSVCKVLGISLPQAADAFGEYWVCTFAPRIYGVYYTGVNSAREFLTKMNKVHEMTTRSIPNAQPPRFDYEWKDDRTLVMTYHSSRNLMDFFTGLVKGVGKHYGENLSVVRQAGNRLEITFPK